MARIYYLCILSVWILFSTYLWSDELPPGWQEGPSNLDAPLCRGFFLADEIPVVEDGVRIRAHQINRTNRLLQLDNNIEVVTEQLMLQGDRALYHAEEDWIRFSGSTEIHSPSLIAETDNIFYHFQDNELFLGRTDFSLPMLHAWGRAETLYRLDDHIELYQTYFSFCDPTEESWHLKARRLNLNLATRQGNAHDIRLYAGRAPIFYLPYLAFPLGNQRQSGLLYPYFSIDNTNGFTYSQPIYFNLAPQLDTTSYLHLIQQRGSLIEQEFRWLTSAGQGEWGLGYLPYDDLFGDSRNAKYLTFSSNLRNGWAGDILFTHVSDSDYTREVPHFFSVNDNFALPRHAHIRYASSQLEWVFGMRDYQLIDEERTAPYNQLPYTTLSYFSPAWYGFYIYDTAEYILFSDNEMIGEDPFYYEGDNGRLHNLLGVGWDTYTNWFFMRSGWNLHTNRYSLDNTSLATEHSTQYFYLDSGLEFSRFMAGCACSFLFQPRLYSLWLDSSSQDQLPAFDTTPLRPGYAMLFSPNQFSGNDRFATANRISFGLENYVLNLNGEEIYRLRVGRAAYRHGEQLMLLNETIPAVEQSPWMLDMAWRLAPNSYLVWDLAHDEEQLVQQGMALKFVGERKSGFSLFYYNDMHQDINREQLGSNFIWQLDPRWSLFGEGHYDIERTRAPIGLTGFSYENCCLKMHLGIYERLRETEIGEEGESGVVFQFFFKPLGGGQLGHNLLVSRIEDIYTNYEQLY